MEKDLFMQATRRKLRYPTSRGFVTTEDLWDLSFSQLNQLFQTLSKAHKEVSGEDSLIETETAESKIISLSMEVVKFVFGVKQAEYEKQKVAQANKAERQKLLEILESKENEALQGLSKEEIQKRIEALS